MAQRFYFSGIIMCLSKITKSNLQQRLRLVRNFNIIRQLIHCFSLIYILCRIICLLRILSLNLLFKYWEYLHLSLSNFFIHRAFNRIRLINWAMQQRLLKFKLQWKILFLFRIYIILDLESFSLNSVASSLQCA